MTDEKESPAAVEAKRQAVILAFSILGAIAMVYIIPLQHDAAARERFMMRNALRVKRFAQWQTGAWEDVAARAATVYNRYRPVS